MGDQTIRPTQPMTRFRGNDRTRNQRFRWGLVTAGLLFCLGTPFFPVTAADKLQRFEFVQIRMGIPVRILVYADQELAAIQATQAAYERIRQIDRALSDYDPDSEVRRLASQHPVGTPVPVSDDLLRVLLAARELNHRSDGAFDVTIGPLVKLWRVARQKHVLPEVEKLQAARDVVGDRYLDVDIEHKTVTLLKAGMQLDFGGIAKGYAADEACRVLNAHQLPISLVAVAGDIRAGDPPPGKAGWRIEVEDKIHPTDNRHVPRVLDLAHRGISTSGDTYQFLEIDGIRYSHIVDPKTGLGLTTRESVTILAPTTMQADGLASTVSILGPKRGLELIAATPGTDVLIVQLDAEGNRQVFHSPGWPENKATNESPN